MVGREDRLWGGGEKMRQSHWKESKSEPGKIVGPGKLAGPVKYVAGKKIFMFARSTTARRPHSRISRYQYVY